MGKAMRCYADWSHDAGTRFRSPREEDVTLILRSGSMLIALWPSMVVGTALVLGGTGLGWLVGRRRSFPAVRGVAWWITRVILPLVKTRSWLRRTATIFVNNSVVSAVLVAVGTWPGVALAAVAILGINIGIALRILDCLTDELPDPGPDVFARNRRRIRLGVALNLLELPAIVAVLGLSIGRDTVSESVTQIWSAFGLWILPTLLVAATGEALWLESYCESNVADSTD